MTHICVGNLTIIGSDDGLIVAWPGPSYCLNQCWNVVNWTIWNKIQWNLNRNSYIFNKEDAFENVVRKLATISSRPQCVNYQRHECRKALHSGLWFPPYFHHAGWGGWGGVGCGVGGVGGWGVGVGVGGGGGGVGGWRGWGGSRWLGGGRWGVGVYLLAVSIADSKPISLATEEKWT